MCLDEFLRLDLSCHIASRNSPRGEGGLGGLGGLCCCDMQGRSNNDGMSLVLARPSSGINWRTCGTKKPCVVCMPGPFWLPVRSGTCCRAELLRSRSDFFYSLL